MQEIQKLVSKNFGYEIDFSKLNEMELFPFVNLSEFQRFLLDSRILPFLRMFLLSKNYNKKFIVGFENTTVFREIEESDEEEEEEDYIDVETEEKGSNLINKIFTGKQLFENELANQDIQQVDAVMIPFSDYPRIEKNGLSIMDFLDDEFEWMEDEGMMFISTDGDLVLFKDKIYATKDFTKELEPYQIFLESFINRAGKANSIPHDFYIKILMSWFTGKVRIKALTN